MLIKNPLELSLSFEHLYAIEPVNGSDCVISLISNKQDQRSRNPQVRKYTRTLVLSHFILENAAQSDWITAAKGGQHLQQIAKNMIVLDDEDPCPQFGEIDSTNRGLQQGTACSNGDGWTVGLI